MTTKSVVNFISGGASTCVSIIGGELPGGILFDATQTVAIIADSHDIDGIQNVMAAEFPKEHIHVVNPGSDFAERILVVLDVYKPDFFHQLGWMPQMPEEVLARYVGLNQHLGPGGKWMFGVRRVYAHMRFCQEVGRIIPIQVFCQLVDPAYDAGKIVYAESVNLDFTQTPEYNAKMLLLSIEHEVQIRGRMEMAHRFNPELADNPANIAQNPAEEEILFKMKKEARDRYPRKV